MEKIENIFKLNPSLQWLLVKNILMQWNFYKTLKVYHHKANFEIIRNNYYVFFTYTNTNQPYIE